MNGEETRPGVDALRREGFARLNGARVGLITNHTGLSADGQATRDLLHEAPGVTLAALFSPEHGLHGALDANVDDSRDARTGLPVHSLYGARSRPTPEQLAGLDTLVYDIQDIGTRFYTYVSTLALCLEAADAHGLRFVVLDRPNPIGGASVEGPLADVDTLSFTACHSIPVRHGLTVGELARLLRAEKSLYLDLEVVGVENWRRNALWEATGLTWVNPSPNMRSLTQALLYPGVGLLETTNVSVGRGTDTPFEVAGAPWLDGRRLARALNRLDLPGVGFIPVRFTPQASIHAGALCGGVNIVVVARSRFRPVLTGLAIAQTLRDHYPEAWESPRFSVLLANRAAFAAFQSGASALALATSWRSSLRAFRRRCQPYLLYD